MEQNPFQSPQPSDSGNPRVRPYSYVDALILAAGCLWLMAVGVGTAMALGWLFSG